MERQLAKFEGRLPYASELYGVYQPLLGWRSRLTGQRIQLTINAPAGAKQVTVTGPGDALQVTFPDWNGFVIDGAGNLKSITGADFTGDLRLIPQPDPAARFETPHYLDSLIVRSLQQDAAAKREGHPPEDPFWNEFWRAALESDALNARFRSVMLSLKEGGFADPGDAGPGDATRAYVDGVRTMLGGTAPAASHIFNNELAVARYLNGLLAAAPVEDTGFGSRANAVLNVVRPAPQLAEILADANPYALIPEVGKDAVLSPVGIVHVFRQYFFEFDNFLGPAVEHVWLAPGTTTELIEVSTRRTQYEQSFERSFERLLSSESSATEEDELSEAVRGEDARNTKLGSTISGGATVLIVHAEASGSLSVEETQRRAREENHRTKRQQSAKLASQIRSNFKSTFRTLTETTDTRSKRYLIENKAGPDGEPPKLRNYELRRKMRQVAIQTQDVGSQLCWQVFVDDPARAVGVGQLVHLAAKSDLSMFATSLPKPEPGPVTEKITILCPVPKPGQQSTLGPIAASGFLGMMAAGVPGAAAGVAALEVLTHLFQGGDDDRDPYPIKPAYPIRQEYKVNLPPGYVIAPATEQNPEQDAGFIVEQNGEIPLKHLQNGHQIRYRMQIASATDGRVLLVVHGGRVTPGELMEFQMMVTIKPTQATVAAAQAENAAIAKENEAKTLEKERVIKQDFVNAVRERVRLASKVAARPEMDLREEERTVIYRALIQRLMRDAWSSKASRPVAHMRSEFVRSIFDVDKMFYSVAPEWWQPRLHQSEQSVGAALPEEINELEIVTLNPPSLAALDKQSAVLGKQKSKAARARLGNLGDEDLLGWGGEGRHDNYMITEDSDPARLGASLGWLLQLDGDNMRNAFLNAPWVKAVIPIRPGREQDALDWLAQAKVEGNTGLDDAYTGDDAAQFLARRAPDVTGPLSVREVLVMVAEDIARKNRAAVTTIEAGPDEDAPVDRFLAPERVFEFGFEHLAGGFRLNPSAADSFDIFDQWVEILPTDQIAAIEVEYDPKTGRML